ncbi:efflux RND transporter periplasmic adaptor subunit [Aestuariibacter salexigens]|uniref:efflux RND transporter periplasmic adaptor subunit n=1 Tax=Aestuariibacter salexigens TaxID=226010 RepID=UPI0004112F0A|nr:HlyD family efflux transporter periplasmic adaptor subunit [Aestuariibacter salexigens]
MKITDTSAQDVVLTKTSTKRPIWIGAAIVLIALAMLFYVGPTVSKWSSSDTSVSAERLRFATVQRGDLVRDLSVQGRVVAAVSPKLYAPAQGTITYTVDAGDSVSKDQILATIDSPELTNQLKQEQASLAESEMALDRQRIQAKKQALENQKAVDMAKVALTAAEREKRRADKAWESQSISNIDYEKAQDDLQNAKLVYQHAVQDANLNKESLAFELKAMELQTERQSLLIEELSRKVEQLTVRSPVDGIVGNLAFEQKNQVAQDTSIMSVVDLTEFEMEVAIPESYADDLAIGMAAEVSLNGETHPAQLVTISPEIENNQVTGRVRFAAIDRSGNSVQPPQGLRQNQRLTTRILMENRDDVLMVQRGQFLESGGGRVAYKVEQGIARRISIETGARSLSSVEILGGLNIGDTIVISSTDQFNGADAVLITD